MKFSKNKTTYNKEAKLLLPQQTRNYESTKYLHNVTTLKSYTCYSKKRHLFLGYIFEAFEQLNALANAGKFMTALSQSTKKGFDCPATEQVM